MIRCDSWKRGALVVAMLGMIGVGMSGCISATRAVGIDTSSNDEQDAAFVKGDYKASAELAVGDKDEDAEIDNDNLLPTLKAGNAYLYALEFNSSKHYLDEAEDIIKYQREQILLGSVTDFIAKVQLSDAAMEYYAKMADSVMVNTYKSIDLMSQGNFADARVELNRAIDRQRRAKEVYAKLMAKQQEAIESKKAEKGEDGDVGIGSLLTKTLGDKRSREAIDQHYSNLSKFKTYPDFVNPFTVYLAGLYFKIQGDYQKSVDLLKEATGMMPNNKVVARDFKEVDRALSGHKTNSQYVWVIFENGLGAAKKEFRVDIPLFIATDKVSYIGVALPEFEPRFEAFSSIGVAAQGQKAVQTQLVADMDRVFLTEFKYEYNDIVTRALMSAVLKGYEQYLASKTSGYLSLAAGALSALTTRADTRTWSTLPKNFQVARIAMPQDREIQLHLGDHIKSVSIDKNAKNAIVYVRIPVATSIPSINVINF